MKFNSLDEAETAINTAWHADPEIGGFIAGDAHKLAVALQAVGVQFVKVTVSAGVGEIGGFAKADPALPASEYGD